MEQDYSSSLGSSRKDLLSKLRSLVRVAAAEPLPVVVNQVCLFTCDFPTSLRALVLCVIGTDVNGVPNLAQEAALLRSMMEKAPVEAYLARHGTPAEAMPDMVARELKAADELRQLALGELFQLWLKSATWKQVMAERSPAAHRGVGPAPSLGAPWSWHCIAEKMLTVAPNVLVKFSTVPLELCFERFGALARRMVCVWRRGEDPESELVRDRLARELAQSDEETTRRDPGLQRDEDPQSDADEPSPKIAKVGEDDDEEVEEETKISDDRILEIVQTRNAYRLLYQLNVDIVGSEPLAWRTIVVSGTVTFDNLHKILQLVLGWQGTQLYKFLAEDGMIIGKNVRSGLSSGKTKLCFVVPLPASKFRYEYGEHQCALTVDKVNWTGHGLENVPRCVDGGGTVPPELDDPRTEPAAPRAPAPRIPRGPEAIGEVCDLDSINDRLIGKRFGANSYHNKFGKQGPALYVPLGTSQDELHRLTLRTYREKLV
eukprot:TRINITY_DN7303_c0_g1_i1.p1 TRINITY_DN7303_c0_g1~~TRINITY_DN7303_c0_g1_i1.p1  ORF type:complete len:487 (+),score=87.50 TRINITY_DN7303_c0_g1_i1:218-1678(+)